MGNSAVKVILKASAESSDHALQLLFFFRAKSAGGDYNIILHSGSKFSKAERQARRARASFAARKEGRRPRGLDVFCCVDEGRLLNRLRGQKVLTRACVERGKSRVDAGSAAACHCPENSLISLSSVAQASTTDGPMSRASPDCGRFKNLESPAGSTAHVAPSYESQISRPSASRY